MLKVPRVQSVFTRNRLLINKTACKTYRYGSVKNILDTLKSKFSANRERTYHIASDFILCSPKSQSAIQTFENRAQRFNLRYPENRVDNLNPKIRLGMLLILLLPSHKTECRRCSLQSYSHINH